MKTFAVLLVGLGCDDGIRRVAVPENRLMFNIQADLDLIWMEGQNDINPQNKRSVSVGDLIKYGNSYYRVDPIGFSIAEFSPA